MVTMLAGLFEPFVFPSQLLWLGRKVDTCLGPRGSQCCAVNWAKETGKLPTEDRGQGGEKLQRRLSAHKLFEFVQEKNNRTRNESEVWQQFHLR